MTFTEHYSTIFAFFNIGVGVGISFSIKIKKVVSIFPFKTLPDLIPSLPRFSIPISDSDPDFLGSTINIGNDIY